MILLILCQILGAQNSSKPYTVLLYCPILNFEEVIRFYASDHVSVTITSKKPKMHYVCYQKKSHVILTISCSTTVQKIPTVLEISVQVCFRGRHWGSLKGSHGKKWKVNAVQNFILNNFCKIVVVLEKHIWEVKDLRFLPPESLITQRMTWSTMLLDLDYWEEHLLFHNLSQTNNSFKKSPQILWTLLGPYSKGLPLKLHIRWKIG